MTLRLAKDYEELAEVCARHGIRISASRVRKVVEHFADDGRGGLSAWRRILEQTTSRLLRQSQVHDSVT